MNILFRRNSTNNQSNSNKDDSFVLQSNKEVKDNDHKNDDDDDDILIVTSTTKDNKPTKTNPTLLTQTVQHLFGKTSSPPSTNQINDIDEKNILEQPNTDDSLIDLN
ncbi:unnamed protein product [Adineta ricciae]|uniref:Uncharacterized protein n=1 Tax=Adineta ricciae TaxID=249248 RepID=A0A815TUZ6_ADIRI|nr:unnamed protein product [Adineta ricciae]CAF1507088.1 unnamed protein product [Adineta ricciae]